MKNYKSVQCKDHPNQNISFLCTEKECQHNRGICSQCKLFQHYDHASKSLKLAILEVVDDLSPRPQILTLMIKIDSLYYLYKNAIKKVKGKPLKEELVGFFNQVRQQISRYPKICQSILQCQTIDSQFYRCLKFYKFYFKSEYNTNKSNYQIFLEQIVQFLQKKLHQLQLNIDSKADFAKILKIFEPFGSQKSFNYYFNETLKHANIKVSNDCLTITQQNSYTCNVIIIEPVVNSKGKFKGKKTLKIKVHKPSSFMSVGVAYLSIVKKNNFVQTTGDIGHGTFVLSYQGYSFHHSNYDLNSFYHTFIFKDEEIITVTINTQTQNILFEKQNNQTVELPYDHIPNQDLYFCACLSNPNESLTIIN